MAGLSDEKTDYRVEGSEEMEIKVLGPGCLKCRQVEKLIRDTVAEEGIEAEVEKVTDVMKIARYGVFGTPAVVVNEEVKSVARVPSKKEIQKWLGK